MNDEQLLRYSRHLLLEAIDVNGQEKLLASHAVIIGAGGLGSAAAPYLAAAGIGKITLIDDDQVDLTNLQRQVMHTHQAIGQNKALSGKHFLGQLNNTVEIIAVQERANTELLNQVLPSANIVLDCTDNYSTRQIINQACVLHQLPLVSGAALRFDGQVNVFDVRKASSPCYACIFSPEEQFEETNCSSMGVFSPLVGIIGSIQAAQALQLLIGFGDSLVGRMLMWNAMTTQIDEIRLVRNPQCMVCGKRHQASLLG